MFGKRAIFALVILAVDPAQNRVALLIPFDEQLGKILRIAFHAILDAIEDSGR